jgi:methylmalonyl-CoA mutase N-terminal domain/subunit
VRTLRDARDSAVAQERLAALEAAARREDENLMPYLLEAARADVTEGEMVSALQAVFGTYTESPVF